MLHKPIFFSATILGALLLLLIIFPMPPLFSQRLAESPWPTYRGNLKRAGRSSVEGPTTDKLRWVFSTGLSEKEGGIETDPVIGPDGTIYFGANNGIFYALDPESGAIRWVFPTDFDTFAIYSTAFVDQQGIVYFGAKDGKVYALTAPRKGIMGEVVWSINLGATIQTSPAFTPDGTLVIGADDWAYYGITPARGPSGAKIKWRFQTQGTLISSPTVDSDGTVFVASMDGKVYALQPPREAGQPVKVLWTFASGGRDDKGGFENAPAIDNEGALYIAVETIKEDLKMLQRSTMRGHSISLGMTGFFTPSIRDQAKSSGASTASPARVIGLMRSFLPLPLARTGQSTSAGKMVISTPCASPRAFSAPTLRHCGVTALGQAFSPLHSLQMMVRSTSLTNAGRSMRCGHLKLESKLRRCGNSPRKAH